MIMTKLEQLIKELCPNGVEYKKLSDIAIYSKDRIDASEVDNTSYIGVDNLLPEKQGRTISVYVPKEGRLTQFQQDDILIGNIRPYLKKIWLSNCIGGTNGDVLVIHIINTNISPKYLYYILSSDNFFLYDIQNAKGAKMPRGSKEAIMCYPIPLPPLEIQEEIVRILDNFTELTAELTTELTAELTSRKKQYEYYRDMLLDFGDDVEWKTLGEITVKISSGKNKEKNQEGTYPVYGSTGIIAYCSKYEYDKKQILIARVGANAGYVHIAEGKYDISDNTIILDVKDTILFKYIYYLLVNMDLNKYAKGGGQPLITAGQIKEIKIPIPTFSEQNRIVNILDRFNKLCNDISEGLPAEIEARRKQYEYYRDKLLSFEELRT